MEPVGHRSQQLHVPENIRLIFQPPYSRQVNPVEHIWDEVREKYFPNRIFSLARCSPRSSLHRPKRVIIQYWYHTVYNVLPSYLSGM